ncbi:membrane protein [Fulvitalea axinellae]|uniref:Membrane protein n=1 Tax=Fulvitalea axinellae TaxID=1182444 RepID=A0AAU9D0J4_9BACT|nr:membrane protein [Fulvitalea axinellae]
MILYLTALAVGLFGSFHCVGMCGPISLALPLKNRNFLSVLSSSLAYNIGRSVTYAIMGASIGVLGQSFSLAGAQRYLSVGTGVAMLLFLLIPGDLAKKTENIKPLYRFNIWVKKRFGLFIKRKSTGAHFLLGTVNGLLPCGLVYIALGGALASGEAVKGALYMAFFGLGTIPMMLFVNLAGKMVSLSVRRRLNRAIPVFVFAMGVLFILRGLNLGIPYVSPKIETKDGTEVVCH